MKLTKKRFVISKSLTGKNAIITFTNKKNEEMSYNHDEVYNTNKERFDNMKCFQKYKSYTCTNNLPTFARSQQFILIVTIACYISYLSS